MYNITKTTPTFFKGFNVFKRALFHVLWVVKIPFDMFRAFCFKVSKRNR